ncbi:MAG: hypothetical protein ACHQYQ_10210, partial [Bacteriovoracales bacterium]
MKKIILFLCLIFIANAWSQSKDVITVSVERQEAKRRTGWTLADWMDTRRTIALQNQWLAFHTYG